MHDPPKQPAGASARGWRNKPRVLGGTLSSCGLSCSARMMQVRLSGLVGQDESKAEFTPSMLAVHDCGGTWIFSFRALQCVVTLRQA